MQEEIEDKLLRNDEALQLAIRQIGRDIADLNRADKELKDMLKDYLNTFHRAERDIWEYVGELKREVDKLKENENGEETK